MSQHVRKIWKGCLAAGAVAALSLMGATAASAGSDGGTLGCGSQYGWLTAQVVGDSELVPPGSVRHYYPTQTGTYTRVAAWADGTSKAGGGSWNVWAEGSANGSPYCSGLGF